MVDQRGFSDDSTSPVDLRVALDRVGEGILVLDRDWRVRFANAAALWLLGREEGGLVGKNVWAEFPTAIGSTFQLRYEEAFATQHTVEFEEYFELLDAWFSIRAYPSLDCLTLVFRDVTYLHDLLADRQALLDRLLKAEDRERARIAAEIHDDTAQALVAMALRLDLIQSQLGATPPVVSALLDGLGGLIASATTGLRVALFGLEPMNPDRPIAESIRNHAVHLFQGSPIRWSVDDDAAGDELPEAERIQALRITKEALNNAHAHAQASQVNVTIRGDESGVEIVIADDGVALDSTPFVSAPGHRGLATMQDRAAVVGGSCTVEATAPHGCTVRLRVPRVAAGLSGRVGA